MPNPIPATEPIVVHVDSFLTAESRFERSVSLRLFFGRKKGRCVSCTVL